jgi:hypothetical protein
MALFAAEIDQLLNRPSPDDIKKNRCRTTVAEPIWGTLAERPVTGHQVVRLGRD